MRLTHLSLTNYRNYARLDADIPAGVLLLVGSNAQGKTSLLEAVYFLATLTAFHADNDKQVINFLAAEESLSVARIVADYQSGGRSHRMEIRIIQEANGAPNSTRSRKEYLLDGSKRKATELFGSFNAVLFLPHMLHMLSGSPEERRRYLNLTLAQIYSGYAAYLTQYQQALSNRNAMLKSLQERNGDASQLDYWDELIASNGAHLIFARIQAVQALERLAANAQRELTRGKESLRLVYKPSYDPLPRPSNQMMMSLEVALDRSSLNLEAIREGFLKHLRASRREEIQRGVTTSGPHRDDLRFLANSIDLGDYGSRGQVRTALLSLKLAELAWMREKTGEPPVLLLDEVLAELDTPRRADLLERLGGMEQSLLTTTDLDLFTDSFVQGAAVWQVNAGRLNRTPDLNSLRQPPPWTAPPGP